VPWLGIAVRDDFQGQGVGSFMLRSLFSLLQAQGFGGLLLRTAVNNLPAQKLYEKHGFERIGTHDSGEVLYLKRFNK
jgi:ribosomal protein S18 acetylase RimI-like enzyme